MSYDKTIPDTRHGAVIEFRVHVSARSANEVIEELIRRGLIEDTSVRSFDARWGGPVWYIP